MISVGVLGCGVMGQRHARIAAADPRVRLAWVSDPDGRRADALADELRCGTRTGEVTLAVNATPASCHPAAFASVVAHWWLIEKPLAASSSAAVPLVGHRVRVGLSERFNPSLRGRPRPRKAVIRRLGPPSGRGTDVDAVFDLLVHDLDLCLRWAGAALTVVSAQVDARGEDGAIDALSAELEGPDFSASVKVSRAARSRERVALLDGERVDLTANDGSADALTAQWSALISEIEGGPQRVATADEALAGLVLAERIRSHAEGR